MDKLFLSLLNMSLTASFVIVVVVTARFVFRHLHAPKVVAYALWAVVLFNLLCPFKPSSVFSLNPLKPAPIPLDIGMQTAPRLDSGVTVLNNAVSAVLPAAIPAASANPLQAWTEVGAYLWAFGVTALLIYAAASYVLLKRKLRFATKQEDGVYETDHIRSPFVLGFVLPKIYLPVSLADADLSYVLCHERTHVKRRDYLVKPVAYLALALHWYNPLVWLAYFLLNADMEMSCDERVLRELGGEVKTVYSTALLNLAAGRRLVGLSPLAFGEGSVKERVKNVMNFKKRSRAVIVAAVALVAVLSLGFAVNKADSGGDSFVFANFKVNGLDPGMDVDSIGTSALTPLPTQAPGVYFGVNDSPINPEYDRISAQLMRISNTEVNVGAHFTLERYVGGAWQNVPMDIAFTEMLYVLSNGESMDYSFAPKNIVGKLSEGSYRFVTEVWSNEQKYTVYAEFTIDSNALLPQRVTIPSDWVGNLDGREMTLAEARRFVNMIGTLTITDLAEFKCANASSNFETYVMLYAIEGGAYRFIVNAGSDKVAANIRLEPIS
ncbi:MAG: M56 family metallopeptidase [Peptococcaceae bacterium]|jgi:beta-lactamase regulating signal transducer with metallopeptidase domain|nr:M56 family metallopeptidase [Peptococcaceae bacterium]